VRKGRLNYKKGVLIIKIVAEVINMGATVLIGVTELRI